jgi:hypothetical protein
VSGPNLRSGNSTSCGCLQAELLAESNRRLKILDPWIADMNLYVRKLRHYRKGPKLKRGSNQFHSEVKESLCRQKTLADTWALSLEDYKALVTQPCYYCGCEPNQHPKGKGIPPDLRRNGIDRADNQKGYAPENCVPCCSTCNRDKRAQLQSDFIGHTRRRYEHLEAKGLITRCNPSLPSSA